MLAWALFNPPLPRLSLPIKAGTSPVPIAGSGTLALLPARFSSSKHARNFFRGGPKSLSITIPCPSKPGASSNSLSTHCSYADKFQKGSRCTISSPMRFTLKYGSLSSQAIVTHIVLVIPRRWYSSIFSRRHPNSASVRSLLSKLVLKDIRSTIDRCVGCRLHE